MAHKRGGWPRVMVVAVLVPAILIATAPPAAAHTVGGVAATDYRSEIVAMTPQITGVSVRLLDLGRRIRLSNTTGADLVVLGYDNEPYLRVGPGGVFQNLHSPAVYQNRLLPAGSPPTTLPTIAQPAADPEWQRISTGHTATWRDRRTRWEGPEPPEVRQNARRSVAVTDWVIPLRQGALAVELRGRIVWIPPPNPLPWVALALVLTVAVVATSLTRWWKSGLSVVLAILVASDVVRSYAAALVSAGWARLKKGDAAVLGELFEVSVGVEVKGVTVKLLA